MSVILTPITGERLAEVSAADPESFDALFEQALAASLVWRKASPSERGQRLSEAARRIRARSDELASLETANTGKLLSDTRREVTRAAECFEYYAGLADKMVGDTIAVPGDFHVYTLREPIGVVVGIQPWNVPFYVAARRAAPALAFGNAIILKPAEETPLTAIELAGILGEAGLPSGLVHVVTGGTDIEQALVVDPGAGLIVFAGSHEGGKTIAKAAATHVVPTVLELGGKSPQLVFEDADLEAALRGVMLGAFGACGQMRVAGSRVYVQRSIYDAFVKRLAERVRRLRVGDPRLDDTQVGPQTTRTQRDRTLALIESSRREGARVLAAADVSAERCPAGGFYVGPTAFVDVDPRMTIMREEIYGPVVAITSFRDEEDAVRHAHETHFGLAAGVWTTDIGRAHRLARDLNVGTVWINSYRIRSHLVPFGGVGLSGYGREGGRDAIETYTRIKSVWTSLIPGLPPGYSI
jgi:acyl-CoA reductase-like NAD-dependent aldehyde dehydrogenase